MFGLEGESLFWFIVIGIVAGWLAGQITHGGGFGLIGDLIVGIIGSFVGGYLANFFGFHVYGLFGIIATATVGAIALLAVIRAL